MMRSPHVQHGIATLGAMKTRTLVALLLAVAMLAVGALVLRGQSSGSIADWFLSLHGGGQ